MNTSMTIHGQSRTVKKLAPDLTAAEREELMSRYAVAVDFHGSFLMSRWIS
jgi:hypothetical protein